ncbi:MAG: hypothetical protein AAFV38_06675 [Pseudomonadota bacterium]
MVIEIRFHLCLVETKLGRVERLSHIKALQAYGSAWIHAARKGGLSPHFSNQTIGIQPVDRARTGFVETGPEKLFGEAGTKGRRDGRVAEL